MTLRQWFSHFIGWLYMLRAFPLPTNETHMWVGLVGRRERECLICHAQSIDSEITDEELERDRQLSAQWKDLSEE
jgi:hypothetical protein